MKHHSFSSTKLGASRWKCQYDERKLQNIFFYKHKLKNEMSEERQRFISMSKKKINHSIIKEQANEYSSKSIRA